MTETATTVSWLRETGIPSVRYLATRDLPGGDSQRLSELKRQIMTSPPVTSILKAQNDDGSWISPRDMYKPKYKSTLWQMVLLAELQATPEERIDRAMQHIFPYLGSITEDFSQHDIHCLMGYSLFFLHELGYSDHELTDKFTRLTVASYPIDGWPCSWASRPDCTWGMIKLLRGLTTIPVPVRPPGTDELIARLAASLLEHRFWFEDPMPDHPYITNQNWLKFGFPLFYESDLLEMLLALTGTGYANSPRVRQLAAVITKKRTADGTWIADRDLDHLLHTPLSTQGMPSQWVTLRALTALTRLEQ